jgi:hypothetical protein
MRHEKNTTLTVDAILSQINAHDRGRPSKAEELEIERTLQPFFAKSYSASFASKKTGYNIKTVTKYYDRFKQEVLESETPDFVKRCKEEKERGLYAYDELIYSLYEDRKDIERLIDASEKIGDLNNVTKLYRIKLKINEDIGNFVSAKTNLANTATVADTAKLLQGEVKNDV